MQVVDAAGARLVAVQVIGLSCGVAGAARVSLTCSPATVTLPVFTTVNV